ncbi:MAG: hypothetical protein HC913_19370 [Microscillaceae bacterium]|nr:hypothetical protein [Microscillaceae bacterium]
MLTPLYLIHMGILITIVFIIFHNQFVNKIFNGNSFIYAFWLSNARVQPYIFWHDVVVMVASNIVHGLGLGLMYFIISTLEKS